MLTRLNDRLSSVAFLACVAALIAFASLVIYVPHLEMIWKDSRQGMPASLVSLVGASHSSRNVRTAIVLVTLLAATVAWRILAARTLRNRRQNQTIPVAGQHGG